MLGRAGGAGIRRRSGGRMAAHRPDLGCHRPGGLHHQKSWQLL